MILSSLSTGVASWSDTDANGQNDTWTDPNTSVATTVSDMNSQNSDVDGDGATNDEEAVEGSNPYSYDTDYDGISDGDELHLVKPSIGVSLTNWDSDGDEVSDYDEWYGFSGVTYPGGMLPGYPGASYSDYDGDGAKNPVDPYPMDAYNGTTTDYDGDGISDASDPFPADYSNYSGYNSLAWFGDVFGDADSDGTYNWQDPTPYPPPDDDSDGFSNDIDPYPNDAANYSSANGIAWYGDVFGDADSDGTQNWQDFTPYPPPADDDSDGISNDIDPYPNDATNYSSANGIAWYTDVFGDADSDGVLNWQDSSPHPPSTDDDSDGLDNSIDPYPNDATNYSVVNNTAWYGDVLADADADGMPNHSDVWPYDPYNGTPPETDSDGDGTPDLSDAYPADPWNNNDSDGDGLTDLQERGFGNTSGYGTDPYDVDTDDDYLSDYEELIVYQTNPMNPHSKSVALGWGPLYTDYQLVDTTDSDYDTIPDRIELFYGMMPNSAEDGFGDLDGNGMSNMVQYSAGIALNADLSRYDSDFDGMTDIFEDYYGLNKYDFADAMLDADNDGVLNFEEAGLLMSPVNTNSRELEGLTDLYFLVATFYQSNPPDWVDDNNNNLPDWYDAALVGTGVRFVRVAPSDLDGDGMPDVWEHRYGRWTYPSMGLYVRANDASADPDNDGLTNGQEYVVKTHPLISDSDGDGEFDGADDTDGDGANDADEFEHGFDPNDADSDNDGIGDGEELWATIDEDKDGTRDALEPAQGRDPAWKDHPAVQLTAQGLSSF